MIPILTYLLAIELAFSFISGLIISPIMSQGIPPSPIEKPKKKSVRLARGRKLMVSAREGLLSWIKKYAPERRSQWKVFITQGS
jgi:hypothetical protein